MMPSLATSGAELKLTAHAFNLVGNNQHHVAGGFAGQQSISVSSDFRRSNAVGIHSDRKALCAYAADKFGQPVRSSLRVGGGILAVMARTVPPAYCVGED